MRLKQKPVFILLLIVICSSCITISGLTDGYKGLSGTNKERVFILNENTIDGFSDKDLSSSVFLINSEGLRQTIEKSDKEYQLLYEYNPHCPSNRCISIKSFLSMCEERNMEPIILSRYLDNDLFKQLPGDIPIYAMDHKKYGTKLVYKYAPLYMSDITGINIEESANNLYLFGNGKFLLETNVDNIDEDLKRL